MTDPLAGLEMLLFTLSEGVADAVRILGFSVAAALLVIALVVWAAERRTRRKSR